MRQVAVIGAGFGDEGKGKVVSYLCSELPKPLVIRFSGGHQAGHRVVVGGTDHVFSNFGSGTLQGTPTYWSEFCTVDPVGLLNEYQILGNKGVSPLIFINARCPVTTPFDKAANLIVDGRNGHGTCGVGVGQTFQREEDHYSLLFQDLFYPEVLKVRLDLVARYYQALAPGDTGMVDDFLSCCDFLCKADFIKMVSSLEQCGSYGSLVFEGAQGLLLDQHYGFFPHVTRANTGVTNIMVMGHDPDVWLVTRAYQTRHGAGPMSNQGLGLKVKDLADHNRDDGHQGRFRKTPLDLSLIEYVIKRSRCNPKVLVVTCIDLLEEYKLTKDSIVYEFKSEAEFIGFISSSLEIEEVVVSDNPSFDLDLNYISSNFPL